uniref:Uncharacterized protein n=1 Tax=Seriola lalandi dorsalis TaxID=1841481 RepID=A0A3B4XR52_SERLL
EGKRRRKGGKCQLWTHWWWQRHPCPSCQSGVSLGPGLKELCLYNSLSNLNEQKKKTNRKMNLTFC